MKVTADNLGEDSAEPSTETCLGSQLRRSSATESLSKAVNTSMQISSFSHVTRRRPLGGTEGGACVLLNVPNAMSRDAVAFAVHLLYIYLTTGQ